MPPRSPSDIELDIALATDAEREWAANLMALSEPWRTLGRDRAGCAVALAAAPETELLIARLGGAAVGFALVRARGLAGSPYIASIAVAPDARGRRIGARLVAHVERRYAAGARHLFLCVSSFNVNAQRFYRRLGFEQVGELPDFLIPNASELILHKRLAP